MQWKLPVSDTDRDMACMRRLNAEDILPRCVYFRFGPQFWSSRSVVITLCHLTWQSARILSSTTYVSLLGSEASMLAASSLAEVASIEVWTFRGSCGAVLVLAVI